MHLSMILLITVWCLGIGVGVYGFILGEGLPMVTGGLIAILAVEVWRNIRTVCLGCGREVYK